ncbi:hypothetical protein [Streptomyces sp. NPDC047718]|uniref:hypothetical protein n=1 Tax=Streptomyces sp. NPDC047718 TaxID=3155479 RepID=UPI0033C05967
MTKTFELVPGVITTRDEVVAAFGGGKYQGIEPANAAKKVFVYSDPSAGEEYGYTFDGRAEVPSTVRCTCTPATAPTVTRR